MSTPRTQSRGTLSSKERRERFSVSNSLPLFPFPPLERQHLTESRTQCLSLRGTHRVKALSSRLSGRDRVSQRHELSESHRVTNSVYHKLSVCCSALQSLTESEALSSRLSLRDRVSHSHELSESHRVTNSLSSRLSARLLNTSRETGETLTLQPSASLPFPATFSCFLSLFVYQVRPPPVRKSLWDCVSHMCLSLWRDRVSERVSKKREAVHSRLYVRLCLSRDRDTCETQSLTCVSHSPIETVSLTCVSHTGETESHKGSRIQCLSFLPRHFSVLSLSLSLYTKCVPPQCVFIRKRALCVYLSREQSVDGSRNHEM